MPHTAYIIECKCSFSRELSTSWDPKITSIANSADYEEVIAYSEDGNDLIKEKLSKVLAKKLKQIPDYPLKEKIICPKCKTYYLSFEVQSFSE